LTLVTSSVSTPAVTDRGPFAHAVIGWVERVARLFRAPRVARGLHNQDALLENQALLARDPAVHAESARLRAAYADLEPTEARHLELIQLVAAADLYVEGRPWTTGFGAGAVLLVNRGSRLVIGAISPKLRVRLAGRVERV
jgi:ElaB/YqjD/DUF883 family membrane-anchored ribosome-binding protein